MYIRMLGNHIGKIRQEKGFTQKQLADKLEWSLRKLTSYERGERVPPLTEALLLAEALDTNVYLLWAYGVGHDVIE